MLDSELHKMFLGLFWVHL